MLKVFLSIFACIFFIFIGGYIELTYCVIKRFEIIDKYPTIVVGVVAAIAAVVGVIISQICQYFFTQKNIESNVSNLNRQHEHALELKDKEVEEQRRQKKHDDFESDKKDFYFQVTKLREQSYNLFMYRLESANSLVHIHILNKIPHFVNKQKILVEYQEGCDQALNNEQNAKKDYDDALTTLNYLHDFKSIGDEVYFKELDAGRNRIVILDVEVSKIIDESRDVSLEDGSVINYSSKYEELAKEFYDKMMELKNEFNDIYNGELYVAQQKLLDNVKEQVPK